MERDLLTEGDLWSWARSVMSKGSEIGTDYNNGFYRSYESYSAHMDAAAAERSAKFYNDSILPALAAAARLGAERERERAARVCERIGTEQQDPRAMIYAAAIRRGEGE